MRHSCVLVLLTLSAIGCGKDTTIADSGAIDTLPPEVTIDTPGDGETVEGEVDISASASDDDDVLGVAFAVDGAELAVDESEPWGATWDTEGLADGAYTIEAWAADPTGNIGHDSVQVVLDDGEGIGPGDIELLVSADVVCGTVQVDAAASPEVESVVFALDGVDQSTDSAAPFSWSWDTTAASNGEHWIRATGTAADGSQATQSVAVEVDNSEACDASPSIAITSPAAGGWYADDALTLEAIASDDGAVADVTWWADGVEIGTSASGDPWSLEWDTSGRADGWCSLTAVATDDAGQTSSSQINVGIDHTAPTVSLDAPWDGALVSGDVEVSGSMEDAGELAEAYLEIDGVVVASLSAGDAGLDDGEISWSWDTTGASWGEHTVAVVAIDAAGNEGRDEIVVSVDNPPALTVTGVSDGDVVDGDVTISAEATDDSEVVSVELLVDGVSAGVQSGDSGTWTWDSAAADHGPHTLTVIATDDAGQTSEVALEIESDQPLEIDLLTDGVVAPSETLAAHAWDDQSIAEIVFELDGSVIASVSSPSEDPGDVECALTDCLYYGAAWDTTGLAEGSYELVATAVNVDGDEESALHVIEIDYDQDGDGDDAIAYGGGDCDDADADVNASAEEVCDGLDNDCDGATDEGGDGAIYYADADGDGYGDADSALEGCEAPSGYVADSGDCDDADADANPGASETCDGGDDDCDGDVDEALSDVDGDGTCDALDSEDCDGLDNDGDGDADEGVGGAIWYADADGDGYGDSGSTQDSCLQPDGYVADDSVTGGWDCDDDAADVNPAAAEICDGIDNDCDGATVEDGAVSLDGIGGYTSIQDAADDAISGSQVLICDGTFYENVVTRVDMTLESLNGNGAVTIDGGGAGSAVRAVSGDLQVIGLTLTGGSGANYGGYTIGGGIDAYGADSLTVEDCVIEGNTATYGGGIMGSGADFISDTLITGNEALSGGGLYAFGGDLYGTEISENDAATGAGLFLDGGAVTMDSDSILEANRATDAGGGAYIVDGAALSGGAVYGNESGDWGGGVFAEGDATLYDLIVEANDATYGGGGLVLYGGVTTFEDSSVIDNSTSDTNGAGGGVWAEYVLLTAAGLEIDGNSAASGGGWLVYGADVELTDSWTTSNSASLYGGGAYLYDNGAYGFAALSVSNVDWGTGSDDNSAEDVELYLYPTANQTYSGYGSGETFDCSLSSGVCL